jgi:hypothetical protein
VAFGDPVAVAPAAPVLVTGVLVALSWAAATG